MKPTQRSLIRSGISALVISTAIAYFLSPQFLSTNTHKNPEKTNALTAPLNPETVLPYTLILPDPQKQAADQQRNLAFYQKRTKQAPKSFMDQNLLANAYISQAKITHDTSWYLLAQKAAERSLAIQAVNPGAWQVLFTIAQAQHDFASAETLHEKITRTSTGPNLQILANHISQRMAQNRLLEAKEAAVLWVEKEPLIAALTQLALVEESQGQYDEALAHLYKGIAREQSGDVMRSSQARTLAGRILAKQGRFDWAERFYQEALRIAPQNILAHELRGDLAFKNKNYPTALQFYAQAYAIEAAPILLMKQAQVHTALTQYAQADILNDKAETALRRELTNHRFGHRRDLAALLLRKNTPASIQEAQTLMEQEYALRQDARTVYIYARSLNANGQWTEAQTLIQKALDQGAVEGILFQEAARTESHLGDKQKAAAYIKAAERYDQSFVASDVFT